MKLDTDFVRTQFPAFAQDALSGQSFFENAGGSYTCKHVIDRLTRFYVERKVQPYAPYEASRLGGEEMDEARVRLAQPAAARSLHSAAGAGDCRQLARLLRRSRKRV